jgi:hypothetical protein
VIALAAAVAAAHPIGNRYVGHQLEITVEPERIAVAYRAEVPDVLGTAEDPALARELASGLTIVADGRALPAERVTSLARGSEHTTRVDVALTAPLGGAREVTVSNGNLPEIPAFHLTRVWTIGQAATSADQPVDAWTRDERQRRVRLSLIRRTDPLARAWGMLEEPDHRPLRLAEPLPWYAPLARATGSPESALLALATSALLALGRPTTRARSAGVLAAAVVVTALAGPALRPVTGGLGAAAIAVLAALSPSRVALAAQAAMCAAQPVGLAVLTASIGVAMPAHPVRGVVPLAVGVAVILAARALSAC